MNGYNLCDASWISARYKTGEVRKVGLRQFFTDVNDIETVNAPVFRGDAAVDSLKWGVVRPQIGRICVILNVLRVSGDCSIGEIPNFLTILCFSLRRGLF